MKIAFPAEGEGLDALISSHMGRAPKFVIYDTQTGEVTCLNNCGEHFGGALKPAELLAQNEVDVLVCQRLGPKAAAMLAELGVKVFVGAEGKVADALESWHKGELAPPSEENICRESFG